MDGHESLKILESLLREFFATHTSNERKREIEGMLDSFSKRSGSWKEALYFLTNSPSVNNDVLFMYMLSVIEHAMKYQWIFMSPHDKSEIKMKLYEFLIQHTSAASDKKCQPFIRNKTIKLLSDIGKFSWPEMEPDFFANILQIVQSHSTVGLGLRFLKIISEEWTNVGDEVNTERKVTLKQNLAKEVPKVFTLLENILDSGLKHRQNSQNSCDTSLNTEINTVISLALEASSHFCIWVNLDGSLPNTPQHHHKYIPFKISFIEIICQYSIFNFDMPLSDSEQNTEIQHALLAFGVLNEILYRKYIPKEFDKQMHSIAQFGVDLLNKILNRNSTIPLPELYKEKVLEFLSLIASSHFNHFDKQSAKAFLSLLLAFTFKEPVSSFYKCLDVWSGLLDHLNAQVPFVTQHGNEEDCIEPTVYNQPILALANAIVQSQLKYQVEVIDDDSYDLENDNVEAPNLQKNIEVLVKIGELLPKESLDSLITTWGESCRFFATLQSALDPTTKTIMRISNPVEIQHFQFIVQLIGRMASIFYSDVFHKEISLGKTLFQQLVSIYNFSQRFYLVKNPDIIAKMNCEIIFSLCSWISFLQRFHSEMIHGGTGTLEDQQFFFELLGIISEVVFYTFENHAEIPLEIVEANAKFFFTLVSSVRTQFIFQIQGVQALVHKIHLLRPSMDPSVYRILNKIVIALLLLPWQNTSAQEWPTRTHIYNVYMKTFLEDFAKNSSNPDHVVYSLNILNDQLDILMIENSNPKKICWNVVKEVVPFLQKLSTNYLRVPKVSKEILSFFCKIMESLRQQAGVPFFENSIHGFLSLFSSENIISDLMRETESSSVVVEKFLEMIRLMIRDSSPSFRKFIDDALGLCYEHIYPILTPDLKIPFFTLIRDLLNYRWSIFFPTIVLHQQNQQNPHESTMQGRLDQIITSIGESLIQQDLEVFRYNLETLTLWNEKHNFYSKLPNSIIFQFMSVIMTVLMHKSQDLYKDEMTRVLHEMSSTVPSAFLSSFLPDFLGTNFHHIPMEERNSLIGKFSTSQDVRGKSRNENRDNNIDLPTFTLILNNFIEDLRHCHFIVECQRLNSGSQEPLTKSS